MKTRRNLVDGVRLMLVTCVFLTPALFDLGSVKPFDIVKTTTVLFFGWLTILIYVENNVSCTHRRAPEKV